MRGATLSSKNPYGIIVARAIAKRKRERGLEKAEKKTKKKAVPKNKPEIDTDVMSNPKIKPYDYIDWSDASTSNNGTVVGERMRNNQMTLLKMPTGSGKTAVSVYALGELQKQHGKPLSFIVIAPSKTVEGLGWHNTIAAYNRAFPDNQLHPKTITTPGKLTNIIAHPQSQLEMIKLIGNNGYIIVDELHLYKNPTSKRSKMLQKINMFHKLGVTATPLTNDRVLDMCSYLILGGYYTSKNNFEDKSGIKSFKNEFGAYGIYLYDGNVNTFAWPYYFQLLDEFKEILYAPNVDVKSLDMPDVESHIIQLEENEQLLSDLKSLKYAQRKRMFESITDYLIAVANRITRDEKRLDKLIDIVKKHKQPLIFYRYNDARDAVIEKLNEHGISHQLISGNTNFEEIDHSSTAPILIQYQAGAASIELKNSDCTIFYENQSSHISLIQGRGRNVRRAMETDLVHHYYLISDCGFDQELYERVHRGEELSNEILEEMAEEFI